MDTGLASYLTGYIDNITLEKSAYAGQIFETYVISEIIITILFIQLKLKKVLILVKQPLRTLML